MNRPSKPLQSKPGTRGLHPLSECLLFALMASSPIGLVIRAFFLL